ncbi:hypothetical protein [Geodermatophilus maliterrae]|uniref:DUF4019 domain-containing protein n=1 Tax=Geodermatophilus maliterrae TaxID=3162531 RepID=A0ABV3XDG3_9ACTN
MVAVVAVVTGIVTHRALTSWPDSPEEVAEAFLAANQRHDREASWELLCHSERLRFGALADWIWTQEAAVAVVGPLDDGLTITVGEARPDGRSSPQSYVVDVQLARADERHRLEVLVMEEDGGFRACGQR